MNRRPETEFNAEIIRRQNEIIGGMQHRITSLKKIIIDSEIERGRERNAVQAISNTVISCLEEKDLDGALSFAKLLSDTTARQTKKREGIFSDLAKESTYAV